jgi:hypothetical protein
MKHVMKALALTAVLSLVASAPALAESLQVMAKVPFAFTAADRTFPTGEYNFMVDNPNTPTMITVESKDGSRYDIELAESQELPEPASQSKVVFDAYGNQHYLAKVYVAGMGNVLVVPHAEIQKEMAQQHKTVDVTAHKK